MSKQRTPAEVWASLSPLVTGDWANLGIREGLVGAYLRTGKRFSSGPPGTAVALHDEEGCVVGVKFRMPVGGWGVSAIDAKDKPPKYLCAPGSKASGLVFGASRLSADTTIVLAAGEKDALIGSSVLPDSYSVVSGAAGEGDLEWIKRLVELAGEHRDYVVCFDADTTGFAMGLKACDLLAELGATARMVNMPDDMDLADYVKEFSATALMLRLDEAPEVAGPEPERLKEKQPQESAAQPAKAKGDRTVSDSLDTWEEHRGRVVKWRTNPKGETVGEVMFAGVPRVVSSQLVWSEDTELGWVSQRRCNFEAKLHPDNRMVRHSGLGFAGFTELVELCAGANRCVTPSSMKLLYQWTLRRSKKHTQVVCASGYCGADRGWLFQPHVQIKGGKVRKHPTAEVCPPGEDDLRRYGLKILPRERLLEVADFVLAKLIPCDHADRAYTLPLLASVLVGPVWTHAQEVSAWQRYSLFVQGSTGIGKSQLVRYFLCFWGRFHDGEGLSTWSSTATSLEELFYRVRGAPFYVGDWKPANLGGERGVKQAVRLLQSYGDRSSRGRANSKAETRARKTPRCQLIIDGEDMPEGEASTLGRMVHLRLRAHQGGLCCRAEESNLPKDLVEDLPGLTAEWIAWCQRSGDWLSEWAVKIQLAIEGSLEATEGATNRRRIVRNHTLQLLALKGFFVFLEELGADPKQCQAHYARAVEVTLEHAGSQVVSVTEQSAGELFLEGLRVLLQSGQVELEPRVKRPTASELTASGDYPWTQPRNNATKVGFYHLGTAHVIPGPVLDELSRRGRSIDHSRKAIAQQLEQAGVVRQGRVRVGGGARVRCWDMALSELTGVEEEPVQEALFEAGAAQ